MKNNPSAQAQAATAASLPARSRPRGALPLSPRAPGTVGVEPAQPTSVHGPLRLAGGYPATPVTPVTPATPAAAAVPAGTRSPSWVEGPGGARPGVCAWAADPEDVRAVGEGEKPVGQAAGGPSLS